MRKQPRILQNKTYLIYYRHIIMQLFLNNHYQLLYPEIFTQNNYLFSAVKNYRFKKR